MSRDTRARALAYIRSGSVHLLVVVPGANGMAESVRARVDGHLSSYLVELTLGAWSCTCREIACPHIAACQLVTGWPTPIRPPAAEPYRPLPVDPHRAKSNPDPEGTTP